MTICGGTNTISGGRMRDLGDAVLLGGDHLAEAPRLLLLPVQLHLHLDVVVVHHLQQSEGGRV